MMDRFVKRMFESCSPNKSVVGEIDRKSGSGNGIINTNHGEMNIGPVVKSSVGTEVEILPLSNRFGFCLHSSVRGENYWNRLNSMIDGDIYKELAKNFGYGGPFPDQLVGSKKQIEIERKANGRSIGYYKGIEIQSQNGNVGDVVDIRILKNRGWGCYGKVINTVSEDNNTQQENADPTDEPQSPTSTASKLNSESPTEPEQSQTGIESRSKPENSDSAKNESQLNNSTLTELRSRAVKESTGEARSSISRKSTQQYNRSNAIREYVMERAQGECEGCGEPAPFISKSGESYLHAHHTEELSEGGSDSIDSVIALCPNCHFRVHHGQNGEKYNNDLTEKLEDIENQE